MTKHTHRSTFLGRAITLVFSALTFSASGLAAAATPERTPDNTKVNERDRDAGSLTPMDQSNSSGDTQIVANIRSALVDDKTLSVNAQNVKVIVRDGVATLRGPVATAEEKARIEALAQRTAGVRSVNSELDIKH